MPEDIRVTKNEHGLRAQCEPRKADTWIVEANGEIVLWQWSNRVVYSAHQWDQLVQTVASMRAQIAEEKNKPRSP